MPGDQAAVLGVSPRRFACDRCKGQKLRCLRERPDQARCDRCARADTECTTTPIFRIRNSTGEDNRARKKSRQDVQRQHALVASADMLPPTIFTSTDSASNSAILPPEMTESWNSPMYGLMLDDGFDGAFTSLDVAPNKPDTIPNNQLPSSYFSAPTYQVSLSTPQSNGSSAAIFGLQDSECNRGNAAAPSLGSALAVPGPVPQVSSCGIEETHTQQLSRIHLLMATQLGYINRGPPNVTLDMLISRVDESDKSALTPVEDLLNSMREFLGVLGQLSSASRPLTSPSPGAPSPRSDMSRDRSNEGVALATDNISPPALEDSLRPAQPSPKSTAGNESGVISDTAILLLILTCYIHVLRIYVVLSTHVCDFLLEISQSDERSICPLPGFDFGNIPLQSGNLQATVFIQIITSLFEKMENLLGIPQQFRVNMSGSDRDGLFSGEHFTEVVKLVIAGEELICQPVNGKGGIKSLRENMKRAKKLLRESIAP
ncbi:hypothetical protein F4677DRAFT_403085 [Hypoxylon crocopeplum]|nr:hypothetical protein F4677DRAFT_403085 [Hypoxylon crocopeplum]